MNNDSDKSSCVSRCSQKCSMKTIGYQTLSVFSLKITGHTKLCNEYTRKLLIHIIKYCTLVGFWFIIMPKWLAYTYRDIRKYFLKPLYDFGLIYDSIPRKQFLQNRKSPSYWNRALKFGKVSRFGETFCKYRG